VAGGAGSGSVVGNLSAAAVARDEGRGLLVVLVVFDVLDAGLAVLQLADDRVRLHVRLGLAGEEGLFADLTAADRLALVAPLVVPGHLVAVFRIRVKLPEDDPGQ